MLTNNYYFIIICLSVVWKCPLSTSPYRYPCVAAAALAQNVYLSVWQLVCTTFTDTHTRISNRSHRYFLHSHVSCRQTVCLVFFSPPPRVCLLCLTAICKTIHVLLLIILLLFLFPVPVWAEIFTCNIFST